MLRFFRQLRKKLMEQNKVRTYILYALGEILLVVIGILIALQINNWNQDRQESKYEHKMLIELSTALESDIDNFRFFEKVIADWEASLFYLADASNSDDKSVLNMDSVKYHLDNVWGFGVSVAYNDGPYEALKSSGLDKISDDSLRKEMTNLYSFQLPYLSVWVNEIIRTSIEKKFGLFELLFDIKVTRNGQSLEKELIVEDLSFMDSPFFADILYTSSTVMESSKVSMAQNRARMDRLLTMIKEELANHSK